MARRTEVRQGAKPAPPGAHILNPHIQKAIDFLKKPGRKEKLASHLDAKRATPYSVWVRKHFAPNSEPYDIIDTELRSLVTRRKDQKITVTDIEKIIANLESRIGGDGTLESHNPFSEDE